MTEAQINVAIARSEGTIGGDSSAEDLLSFGAYVHVPDYYNDLNLCREFEKNLKGVVLYEYDYYIKYIVQRCISREDNTDMFEWGLSSMLKCEAYLRAKRIWNLPGKIGLADSPV